MMYHHNLNCLNSTCQINHMIGYPTAAIVPKVLQLKYLIAIINNCVNGDVNTINLQL